MEYEYQETKQGHPGLALLLGIFAILIAFFVGGVFGLLGIVPAAILAVIAIVLGAGAVRAAGRGKGAIVTGVIAILISLMMLAMTFGLKMLLESDEVKQTSPTFAKYAGESWKGIGGVIFAMSKNGADIEKIQAEFDAYNNRNNPSAQVTTPATETAN